MTRPVWPELSWDVPSSRLNWLIERTQELAYRTRAFELALEEASEAGEAPLSKVAEELEEWEGLAANLWMYVGLKEAKQLPTEDVPSHAEELAKVYANLRERRETILQKLGPEAAEKVLVREAGAKVDSQSLLERAGELPNMTEVDSLGVAQAQFSLPDETIRPLTAEEFRQRGAHESKPLPEPAHFKALLNALPPPWVHTIFDTIGLELPEELVRDEDDEEVELTANSRSTLQKRVLTERMNAELLRQIVFALDDADRQLLSELISQGGAVKYAEATAKYGKDDADGFFWQERPPSGPVARLRRVGLGFVGMRGGKQVLQAPEDLVEMLRAWVVEGTV